MKLEHIKTVTFIISRKKTRNRNVMYNLMRRMENKMETLISGEKEKRVDVQSS